MIHPSFTQLTLPDGLIGLPDATRFAVQVDEASSIVELVSAAGDGLDFLAAPLDGVAPGLRARLVDLGHATDDDLVLVLLAVHGDPPTVTANLAGPLVVQPAAGTGCQLVLEGDDFPLRAPLAAIT